MNCSRMPDFPVLLHLPELAETHVHCVGDAIQPSHPLSSPSPPALNLSQHQGLPFSWSVTKWGVTFRNGESPYYDPVTYKIIPQV